MSDEAPPTATHHLIGLALAALAIAAIGFAWSYGLDYLNGTVVEELRYIIFAIFVVGLLSGLQNLISRIMH